MKIFLTASKSAYGKVAEVKQQLEALGHTVTPPNGYENPEQEARTRELSPEQYAA